MFSLTGTTATQPVIPAAPEGFKYVESKIESGATTHYFEKRTNERVTWTKAFSQHAFHPFGYLNSDWACNSLTADDYRFETYFPIKSFDAAREEMDKAISPMSYFFIDYAPKEKTHSEKRTLANRDVMVLNTTTVKYVSLTQKVVIVALAVVAYFRALISFFQVGIIFAPIDLATTMVYNRFIKA